MVNPDLISGRLGNKMFQIAYLYSEMRRGNIPDIYVQDPEYFSAYSDEIKRMFGAGISDPIDMVAIHVRRGDYVGNSFYVDLMETPYYIDAMAQFPDASFLVFSDDIGWCEQQDIFKGCEFSYENELNDLNLMASCTGHIIANSSFSWWGAYISPYSKKIVAPKKWYSDKVQRTKLPDSWIQL